MNERMIIKVVWYIPLELNHASYIYTSLVSFCEQNNIKFEISAKNLNVKGVINVSNDFQVMNGFFDKICYVKLIRRDKSSLLLAFDSYDLPDHFSKFAYDTADYVFKRSYQTRYIKKLPDNYKSKTLRFGLPFMVRPLSIKQSKKFKTLYISHNFKRFLKYDRYCLKRIITSFKYSLKTWKVFENTRTLLEFENRKLTQNSTIFFQKRLFPNEESNDVKAIHNERIRIVRLLKNNYKNLFKGGIQNSEMARKKCPECISNIFSQHDFLEAFKNAEICIYTRGLAKSTGWTLSEFLAQGKCIISEQIYNEIPILLKDDREIVFFSNKDDLTQKIDELLLNDTKREELKQNALNYYRNYISPNTFFRNLIRQL